MKQSITVLFCSISLLFGSQLPSFAQSNSCRNAVINVRTTIQNRRNIVVNFEVRDVRERWRAFPSGRLAHLVVKLGGYPFHPRQFEWADDILNSPQMLNSLSHQIISNCGDVSAVTYAKYRTGLSRTFGIVNGSVRQFQCIDPGNVLRWGQHMCSV
ncbi:hypothetical protein AmaxDRAFT_0978 [Limnospira maxima CS-328]|uniref:Uncharacterized protein n=2 Tax=Limnospira TaxID=2596745 RepID=A0A9P1P085_9CYAN|nr:hypothetical protein AmaxDRAFT_0978 [Limnospira maxima CS-328]CDM96632.1 conserved exported protein of unknown function [Limnospira indica PCC 8005]